MITVAVDGSSGSGKSTVCGILAKKLGILHLNTGALYRAVGLYCIEHKLNTNNDEDLIKHLDNIQISVEYNDCKQITFLNGKDVTNNLYSLEVSDVCSQCAAFPVLRKKIVEIQRDISKSHSVVMEGRDITWFVLPNAQFKFYINASPEVRAKRRVCDAKNKDTELVYENVLKEIKERDRRDKERAHSPLILVEDAVYINTDNYTIEEVVEKMYNIIKEKE